MSKIHSTYIFGKSLLKLKFPKGVVHCDEWLNEWMMHLYRALLCIAIDPKRFTIMWGVSPQPPPVCSIHLDDATAATGQRHQCAHHTPATGGEEREIEPVKWMGLLGGHDWQGPVEGIWPGHRGYTPTLYEKCHGIFNDHRESGTQFNVSSERRCSFDSIVSRSLYWGIRTHTGHRVSTPCWPH